MRVVVFSTTACPHCVTVKETLGAAGASYVEVNLDDVPHRREEMVARTGIHTVPQVFIGEKFIGTATTISSLAEDGRLVALVGEARQDPGSPTPLWDAHVPPVPAGFEPAVLGAPDVETKVDEPDAAVEETKVDDDMRRLLDIGRRMVDPTTGVKVGKSRRYLFAVRRNVVTGAALADWCVQHLSMTRRGAVVLCARLMHAGVFAHVGFTEGFEDASATHYRFQEHRTPAVSLQPPAVPTPLPASLSAAFDTGRTSPLPSWAPSHMPPNGAVKATPSLLNTAYIYHGVPHSAATVGTALRQAALRMYGKFLSGNGKALDYGAVAASTEFADLVRATAELQVVDLSGLVDNRQLCKSFFINLYNVVVVHAFVALGPPDTNWQRLKFFDRVAYRVGPFRFSLNDIEHGVLRGNRAAPFHLRRQFGSGDPRLQYTLPDMDPRIHFALVCGARSCPAISLYSAKGIDAELDHVTRGFLQDEGNFRLDAETATVHASKLLQWYGADFGSSPQAALRWCQRFLQPRDVSLLHAAMADTRFTLEYLEYNWALNGTTKVPPEAPPRKPEFRRVASGSTLVSRESMSVTAPAL